MPKQIITNADGGLSEAPARAAAAAQFQTPADNEPRARNAQTPARVQRRSTWCASELRNSTLLFSSPPNIPPTDYERPGADDPSAEEREQGADDPANLWLPDVPALPPLPAEGHDQGAAPHLAGGNQGAELLAAAELEPIVVPSYRKHYGTPLYGEKGEILELR